MTNHAKIIAGGKVVIPALLRREMSIVDGDPVVIARDASGSLSIKTHDQIIAEGRCAHRAMLKQPFAADEFVADRRRDAEDD